MKIGTSVRLDCVSCGNSCGNFSSGWCIGTHHEGASILVMLGDGVILQCPAKYCARNPGAPRRLLVPSDEEGAAQFLGLQAKRASGPTLKVVGVVRAARETRLLVRSDILGSPAQIPDTYEWWVGYRPSSTEEDLLWIGESDCLLTPLTIIGDGAEASAVEEDSVVAWAMALRERRGGSTRTEDQSWATGWSGRLF